MADLWLDPAAPGTVSPAYLQQVRDLHAAVRAWLAASVEAQQNPFITATRPYADLTFAFGFATLGDEPSADALLEDARRVLVVPVPEAWNDNTTFEATVVALVGDFLFRAFRYRVQQALAGSPLGGSLATELLADRAAIQTRVSANGTNNPHLRAAFVIDTFRTISRIVEPEEEVDPYAFWAKPDSAKAGASRPACVPHSRRPPSGADESPPRDLDALKRELIEAGSANLAPAPYTELARDYATALGRGHGAGLRGLIELFRKLLPPKQITNTWTTASYYSRFHLLLIEDAVFAACQLAPARQTPA